jgi:hypothetical protein
MDRSELELIERDLRDVLTSDRRALSSDLVPLERVHAGAVRRRRRRTAALSAATAVLLVAIAVPVSRALLDSPSGAPLPAADKHSPTASVSTPTDKASSAPTPTVATAPVGPAWDGAFVHSVTATSEKTFVVLGFPRDCTTTCLRLAQTRDGGRTFTPLAVPAGVGGAVNDPTPSTVMDVRFGSADDGWLFGDGLWSTHDGGAHWGKQKLPGRVQRLEAAAGTVWALVTPLSSGKTTTLWRAPVGSDEWTKVPDVSLTYAVDLSVQGQHVVAIGGMDSKAWVGDRGKFVTAESPCPGGNGFGGQLSATGSLWAVCGTGTAARLLTSADGTTWKQVVPSFLADALPNQAVIGARTASDAVLSLGPSEPFYRIQSDGSGAAVKQSPTGGDTGYIGFTSRTVGYAVTNNKLWRTDDGGDTWTKLKIG